MPVEAGLRSLYSPFRVAAVKGFSRNDFLYGNRGKYLFVCRVRKADGDGNSRKAGNDGGKAEGDEGGRKKLSGDSGADRTYNGREQPGAGWLQRIVFGG